MADEPPKRKATTTTTNTTTQKKKKKKKKDKRSLSDLKTLGRELLSSRAHINNLPLLLNYISPSSPPHYVLEALLSLQSFFPPVLHELPSSSKPAPSANGADPEVIYRTWLRAKFDDLVKALIDVSVCSDCEETLREVVVDTLMEFVKLGNRGKFYSALYHKLIQAIVCSSLDVEFLLESLASTYFKYMDVRYFTFITIENLCKILESGGSSGGKAVTADGEESRESLDSSIKKVYFILSHIPPLGTLGEDAEIEVLSTGFLSKEGDDQEHSKSTQGGGKKDKGEKSKPNKNGFSLSTLSKKMKLKFTKAWMSFLRLPLPLEVYKEVLVNVHQMVMPYMSNPAMLCDFLTRSYDIGGVVSVMALSGLHVLMIKHGLEYPNFYEKLYALLTPSIFMAKHRAKFFQLLDFCLKSPLLPAYLAAAFTKKLSRLSLIVPPSGSLVIIALVHNLLRRHPSINCLVHQDNIEGTNQDKGVDLFNDEESNPIRSNAMRSSLWEIDTLRHHYCAPVSRFVSSLENDLTVRAKTTEVTITDFSSGSYSTIFKEEMGRRVKQVPLAFYKATPTSLFSESDFPGWSFNYDEVNLGLEI